MKKKQVQGIQPRKKRTSNTRSFQDTEKKILKTTAVVASPSKKRKRTTNQTYRSQKDNNSLLTTLSLPYRKLIKKQWRWLQHIIKVIVLVVAFLLFFNAREQTLIILRPHHEIQELKESVVAYKNPKIEQLGFDIIAITDEVTIPIVPTGERTIEKKAQGTVTLYNNYSSEPQRILPETRFLSAGNKLFHLGSTEVIIPGKTNESPGKIDVVIYAEHSGPEFNIEKTDFSLPGFKELGLSDKYDNIYASSTSAFSGGVVTIEKYVDEYQQDILRNQLQDTLRERLVTRLSKEETEQIVLVKKSAQISYEDVEYQQIPTGDILVQRGRIISLVIGKSDLRSFLNDVIVNNENNSLGIKYLDNLEIIQHSTSFNFEDSTSVPLIVSSRALLVSSIDEEKIKKEFIGASFKDSGVIFEKDLNIDSIAIKTWPFWKRRVTPNIDKLFIEYK